MTIFGCSKTQKLEISILQTKLDLRQIALDNAQKQITKLGFRIYNQQREIARLHKTIKELKNGKN